MTTNSDRQLLDQFVQRQSQAAFAELVNRHVGMVYNAAMRQVRNSANAEDVCQAVFIILARRASSLSPAVNLPGWLIKTTYLASRDLLKAESRRRRHEQHVAAMSPTQTPSCDIASFTDELSPEIDRALSRLSHTDRGVIVLRYLRGQSLDEVAAALAVSPRAAMKRLQRAMAKVRAYFSQQPIVPSIAVISTTMEHLPQLPTPEGLAHSATTAAMSGTLAGTSASIVQGVLKMMFWTKAKLIGATAAVVLLGTATVGTISFVRADSSTAPSPGAPLVAPSAPAPTSPNNVIASLSNGVSVEIVSISEYPSKNKPFWTASGAPLVSPPYSKINAQFFLSGSGALREIALRIHDAVAGSSDLASYQILLQTAGVNYGQTNAIDRTGRNIEDIEVLVGRFPPDLAASPTLRVNIAAGAWTTRFKSGPDGASASDAQANFVCGPAFEAKGATHFVLSGSADLQTLLTSAIRAVVVDTAGQTTPAWLVRSSMSGLSQSAEYASSIPLKRVAELQLQTRKFDQWIEIRNICIDSSHPTKPEVATSDEPPGL